MKICVLGSGSLGSVIGGMLTEGGSEVYLIRRSIENVNKMNRRGLKIREDGLERTVQVQAVADCHGIGTVDLIIVLVKSYDTREAIKNAKPMIGDDTVILSLQNGLGNEEIIAEVAGEDHVLAGRTYVGGVMLNAAHVIAGAKGKNTYIGELDGRITKRVRLIAEIFNRAGLSTSVSTNVLGLMWDKLLVNVATGALSGVTRLPYGGLYQVPEVRDCALEAVSEAMAVAKAMGIKLSIHNPIDAWTRAAEGLHEEFKASILQSIEKGLRTEIDFINGAVVHWGKKYKIPTPVNRTLVASIKGIELWLQNYAGKE